MNYKVSHPTSLINCEINLPSSKSISNRLLIIKALCRDKFDIKNLSDSDDTTLLSNALNNIKNKIDVRSAGTSFRFLCSYLSILEGQEFILTGTERMKERPIKELVNALNSLGADISYLEKENFPPLKIIGKKLLGGKINIDGSISSQFISSLLLIAPTLENGLRIHLKGKIVSRPYIQMTLNLMQEFGIYSIWKDDEIYIDSQSYIAKDYIVESDWSAAAFWFQIVALSKDCQIRLKGLQEDSIQGDIAVINLFRNLSVSSTFEDKYLILTKSMDLNFPKNINLINSPDLYLPLLCTLFALDISSEITGIDTLKDKESNRITSTKRELKRLYTDKKIDTYDDHRIAMSFALLSLKFGSLMIHDADVVSKSYPNFWQDIQKAGFIINS